jgi:hypothetical protein
VKKPLPPDALDVVVEEGGEGEGEGRVRIAGRRLQEVEDAEDVRQEDEHRERADDRQVALAGVPDDVVQHAFQAADDHLHEVLQRAGVVAVDTPRGGDEQHRADEQHQQGHDDVIGDVPGETVLHAVPQRVHRLVENRVFVSHRLACRRAAEQAVRSFSHDPHHDDREPQQHTDDVEPGDNDCDRDSRTEENETRQRAHGQPPGTLSR